MIKYVFLIFITIFFTTTIKSKEIQYFLVDQVEYKIEKGVKKINFSKKFPIKKGEFISSSELKKYKKQYLKNYKDNTVSFGRYKKGDKNILLIFINKKYQPKTVEFKCSNGISLNCKDYISKDELLKIIDFKKGDSLSKKDIDNMVKKIKDSGQFDIVDYKKLRVKGRDSLRFYLFIPYKVNKVEIVSDSYIDKNYWLEYINIIPGISLKKAEIDEIKSRLFETKVFDNISIKKKNIDGKNLLIFTLYKKIEPIYDLKLFFEGDIDKVFWKNFIGIKKGDRVTDYRIEQIKNKIVATEKFSDVIVQKKYIDKKFYLYLFLIQKPIVKEISIIGNFPLLETEINRKIFFKVGEYFDEKKIEDSLSGIEKLYEENGFFNSKVEITYKFSKDDKYVFIIVEIKNIGVELSVNNLSKEQIKIEDEENYNNQYLKKIYKEVRSKIEPTMMELIEEGFTENNLKKRMENLRIHFQNMGYLSCKVRGQTLKTSNTSYMSKVEDFYKKNGKLNSGFLDIRKRGFVIDYNTRKVDPWILVDLGPKVKLKYEGFKNITEREIKDNLTIFKIGSISPNELKNSINNLQKYYQSQGYYFSEVSYKVKNLKNGDKIITFIAKENKKLYIRGIKIKGIKDDRFNEDLFLSMMSTGEYQYLGSKGYLQDAMFVSDLKTIISHYRENGYLQAKIKDIKFKYYKNKKYLDIEIVIDEGKITKIKKVNIKWLGKNGLKLKNILKQLQQLDKKSFSPKLFNKNKQILTQYYRSNGYPFAVVERFIESRSGKLYSIDNPKNPIYKNPNKLYSDLKGDITLTFYINQGKEVKFGDIFIKGNFETRTTTVIPEIAFRKGDRISNKALIETRDNLRSLGVFKLPSVKQKWDGYNKKDSVVDVVISLEEGNNQYIDFSIGTSSDEKYSAQAEFVEKNIFGFAKKISLLGQTGEIYNKVEANYTDPRLLNFKLTGNLKGFYRYETLPAFTLNSLGSALSLFKNFTKKISGFLSFELEQATTERFISNNIIEPDIFSMVENSRTTSFIVGFYYEGRDNLFDPRKGAMFRTTFKLAWPLFIENGDQYIKYNVEYTHCFYLKWLRRSVLAIALRFGEANTLDDDRRIPEKERFFLGGDSTIRGYDLNMVGPIENNLPLGDNAMAVFNIELRVPAMWKFWLAFFFDAGGVSSDIKDFWDSDIYDPDGANKIRYSAGIGVRYMTIIGPIRLDFAWKLNEDVYSNETFKTHFNFSYPF